MAKRIISLWVALSLICISAVCAPVFAEDDTPAFAIGELSFNVTGTKLRAGAVVQNDGTAKNMIAVAAAYLRSGSRQLADCKAARISLQSGETQKYITFDCGDLSEERDISILFFDADTMQPLTEKRQFDASTSVITIPSEKVYPDDSAYAAILGNRFAVHMQSGVVHANGEKYQLLHTPYSENGEYMLPQEAVETALSATISQNGSQITVGSSVSLALGSKQLQKNGTTTAISAAPTQKDGVLYLPLGALAKAFDKTIYTNDTTVNNGMVIVGDSAFTAPSASATLQGLNDYLLFIRPSAEQIRQDYQKSGASGVHPRVMMTPSDVTRLKTEIKQNSVKKNFYDHLAMRARDLVNKPPDVLEYDRADGLRMMDIADQFEGYMLILGLAYQLYGDASWKAKFVNAAWRQIEAVASFPDWNPQHHLDVGIMSFGFAIAYDWMYDAWTAEQRSIMENAIYNHCFSEAYQGYVTTDSDMDGVVYKNNHNAICNSGICTAALAFMDVYPELGASFVADGIRCLEYMLPIFAPEGCSYEGPSYAALTVDYLVRMFASLESGLSDLYALDCSAGLDNAAKSFTYLKSDVGGFSFNDGGKDACNSSALFWMYRHYQLTGLKDALASYYYYTYNDNTAQCVLFYDVSNETGETDIGTDHCYYDTGVATMRNHYQSGQVFVGIKAGNTVMDRSHLDQGSFIFDALGVRWAVDFGKDSYGLPGYFDWRKGTKWNIFRQRAQSHNTLIINPDMNPEFVLGSRADILSFETASGGVKTVVDMNAVLADDATSAKRGFLFTDQRQSLVVRDELTLPKTSDVYWLMYTKANTEVSGNTVTLTDTADSTKKVTLEFCTSASGTIIIEDAKPMKGTPVVSGQNSNKGYKRIAFKVTANGDVSITAKLTPVGASQSAVSDYDKPIAQWTLPS